jgi:hypothetical protein
MPQENPAIHGRGGIGQPADPAKLQSPGASHVDYPTVLVARDDDGLDGPIVHFLQRNGFHVLEVDWADVFDVVKVHSRPIHLLLANVSMDAHVPILKQHRSELQVLFVKKPVDADVVLANVRQLLG